MDTADRSGRCTAAVRGAVGSGKAAVARCLSCRGIRHSDALSNPQRHGRQRLWRRSYDVRLHARRHGSSVQRHWIPPVALSIPHDPSRVVWAALSAIGKRQRRGGSGSGSASLTVPSSRSRATRSASELNDLTVLVACSDFGNLAAVVRACGGGELQVSGAGKPWSAPPGRWWLA